METKPIQVPLKCVGKTSSSVRLPHNEYSLCTAVTVDRRERYGLSALLPQKGLSA